MDLNGNKSTDFFESPMALRFDFASNAHALPNYITSERNDTRLPLFLSFMCISFIDVQG